MGTNRTPAEMIACKPMNGAEMAHMVEHRLFEAGFTLACLPAHGIRPSSRCAAWGETLMDLDDLLSLTAESEIRPPMPSAAAISRMDEAFDWVQSIQDAGHRRVVLLWMMIHPLTRRHRYSWRQIGDTMGKNHHTIKSWFHRGLASITKKIYA